MSDMLIAVRSSGDVVNGDAGQVESLDLVAFPRGRVGPPIPEEDDAIGSQKRCGQDGRHDTVFRSISQLDPPDDLHSDDCYAADKSSKVHR